MGTALNSKQVQNSLSVISNALAGGGVSLKLCAADSGAYCFEENPGDLSTRAQVRIPNADFTIRGNLELAEGQAVHEALHCIFTDMLAILDLVNDTLLGFRKGIFNSLEDAYIEYMGEKRWRGIRKILNRRLIQYKRKGFLGNLKDVEGIDLIDRYIYFYCSVKRNRAPLQEIFDMLEHKLISMIGLEYYNQLNEILEKGIKTTSSEENAIVANEIGDWLKNLVPNQPDDIKQTPQPSEKSNSDESQDGKPNGDNSEASTGNGQSEVSESQEGKPNGDNSEASTGNSQSEASESQEGKPNGDNSEASTGNSQSEASESQDGKPNGDNSEASTGNNQNDASDSSLNSDEKLSNSERNQQSQLQNSGTEGLTPEQVEALKKQAKQRRKSFAEVLAGQALKELNKTASTDDIETCKNYEIKDTGERFEYHRELRTLQAALRRPLEAMLKAQTWKHESFGRRGELDSARLNRVITDGKAMRTETITIGESAAVSLLLDASSSMDSKVVTGDTYSLSRMEVAEITLGALANTLDGLGIPCEAWKYCRVAGTGAAIFSYKKFYEKPRKLLGRLGRSPSGGTPTGEALFTVIANMSKRTEPKKIIYVITDGEAQDENCVQRAYDMAVAVGIKVKFICIGVKWKSPFAYDQVAEIDSAKDLPKILQKMSLKDL
ncbi:VWA domain-containing protein [Vibrio parahaemolyticus]|nr:VWA domain-containing protein [Vibrio parahaemolyticus]EJG0009825.1 VWA domain-containing protein [Vibrio parahaemolyticus]